jgi:hypothetical protein
MAQQTDVLETILKLAGAAQYIRYLNQAAQAHQRLAQAQQQQARAQAQVQAAIAANRTVKMNTANMAGGVGVAAAEGGMMGGVIGAAALAALVGTVAAIKSGVEAFADYDRALLRTQLFMHNFGQSLPVGELRQFDQALARSTGSSQTEILGLQAYLSRFNMAAPQLQHSTKVIVDASKATGIGLEEMARAIEMARKGNAKALFADLGIPIKNVAGYLGDYNAILAVVERHTKGMAATMGNTLPGSLDKANAAVENLKLQFGDLIGPFASRSVRGFTRIVDDLADAIERLNGHRSSALGTAVGGSDLGAGGSDQSEDYLRRIAFNTGPQGTLGAALRGGGSFGEPGGGLRIRDFNQMFRGVA